MRLEEDVNLTELAARFYTFLKRNLWFVLGFLIVGLAIGFVINVTRQPFYETSLVGYSSVVSNEVVCEMVSPLQVLAEEKNYGELGKALNITTEQAEAIREITVVAVESEKPVIKDAPASAYNKENVRLTISTFDANLIPVLEQGVLNFFDNNAFLQKKVEVRNVHYKDLIANIEAEISKLDSFQLATLSALKNQDANQINLLRTPGAEAGMLMLYERLQKTRDQQTFNTSFTVVSPFPLVMKPVDRKIKFMGIFGSAFLLLGVFISSIREVNRLVNGHSKNKA